MTFISTILTGEHDHTLCLVHCSIAQSGLHSFHTDMHFIKLMFLYMILCDHLH